MNLSLQHKYALVGGASAGIGQASAIELAALGANVILLARDVTKLEHTLTLLDRSQGQTHTYRSVDYSDRDALRQIVSELVAQQPIHILVNNTGGPPGGPLTQADEAQLLFAYSNHLLCNQLLAQLLLPGMKADGYGRIINIISTSVKEPLENLGVSNTTRWAVAAWAKTWAQEVGQFGITVNNVLPGFTETDRLEEIVRKRAAQQETSLETVTEAFKSHVPLRRFAQPGEVAAAVAFLASPAAGYIHGVNLPVDGGRTKSL